MKRWVSLASSQSRQMNWAVFFRTLIIFVPNIIWKISFTSICTNVAIIFICTISWSIPSLLIWQSCSSKKSWGKSTKRRSTIPFSHDMQRKKYSNQLACFEIYRVCLLGIETSFAHLCDALFRSGSSSTSNSIQSRAITNERTNRLCAGKTAKFRAQSLCVDVHRFEIHYGNKSTANNATRGRMLNCRSRLPSMQELW